MVKSGRMQVRRLGIRAALAALLAAHAGGALAQEPCAGDCDGTGTVVINELVLIVNIILEIRPESECEFGLCEGGPVDIACLIGAVNHSLQGCPGVATSAGIVFNGEANRLAAYQPGPRFEKQVVVPSDRDAPGVGRDVNGQICFTRGPQGETRFIAGEDTDQGASHATAGWGLFELSGSRVGDFGFEQIGKLLPTYQTTEDGAENYGCGFLSDGRLLTTDVGNQAGGPANGQLIIWFPPFENGFPPSQPIPYCKLDIAIATAQQIAIDAQDHVYVGSARPGASPGIYRYAGPFPTSNTPEGGCDGTDSTGAPMATGIEKELVIPADNSTGLITPAGVVLKPDGGFYVGSVLNGVIAEFDADYAYIRKVLDPPVLGLPIPTGHPLGLGLASDGTIYFADIGLVGGSCGICPGNGTGTVRRIRFVDGAPQAPEIMATGLNFPDGIGILEAPPGGVNTRKPTSTPRAPRTPLAAQR